jgi:hypothetical protein
MPLSSGPSCFPEVAEKYYRWCSQQQMVSRGIETRQKGRSGNGKKEKRE